MFDFRIRNKDGGIKISHGITTFDSEENGENVVITSLKWLNQQTYGPVYIRILLDNPDWNDSEFNWFEQQVANFVIWFPRLRFVGGFTARGTYRKISWLPGEPTINHLYNQDVGMFNTVSGWAKKNNPGNKQYINRDTWCMFDYWGVY